GENLLAVDDESAGRRPRLGAEGDAARRRGAAFRERLRVDRAVIEDAPVVQAAARNMGGAVGRAHIEIVGERARPQGRAYVHVEGERGRAAVAAELRRRETIGAIAGAEPAVLLGDADAEQALAVHV